MTQISLKYYTEPSNTIQKPSNYLKPPSIRVRNSKLALNLHNWFQKISNQPRKQYNDTGFWKFFLGSGRAGPIWVQNSPGPGRLDLKILLGRAGPTRSRNSPGPGRLGPKIPPGRVGQVGPAGPGDFKHWYSLYGISYTPRCLKHFFTQNSNWKFHYYTQHCLIDSKYLGPQLRLFCVNSVTNELCKIKNLEPKPFLAEIDDTVSTIVTFSCIRERAVLIVIWLLIKLVRCTNERVKVKTEIHHFRRTGKVSFAAVLENACIIFLSDRKTFFNLRLVLN